MSCYRQTLPPHLPTSIFFGLRKGQVLIVHLVRSITEHFTGLVGAY